MIARPHGSGRGRSSGVVGGDGCEVVESGETVGGQGESGAPGFMFERPDPVSGHPDCEAGDEDGEHVDELCHLRLPYPHCQHGKRSTPWPHRGQIACSLKWRPST